MPGKQWVPKYISELLDGVSLSTDGTMAGNSDLLIPTQKAVKTYADTQLALKAPLASPVFTTQITTPIVNGAAGSGGNLTLSSTSHATKGKLLFGTSAYDEVNNRLGIGTISPTGNLVIASANSPVCIFTGGNSTSSSGMELLRIATNYYGRIASSTADTAAISIVSTGNGQASINFNISIDGTSTPSTPRMTINNSNVVVLVPVSINGAAANSRTFAIGGDGIQRTSGFDYSATSPDVYTDIYGAGLSAGWSGAIRFFTSASAAAAERMRINASGNVGIGITNPNQKLEVNGNVLATQYRLSVLNTAPSSATATGVLGEIRVDDSYIYICTATNTWKRSALTTW